MAQTKAERLIIVPKTAHGFQANIAALRSLDGGKGVSFHSFSVLENRTMGLQVKNVDKSMLESVVQKEVGALGNSDQGAMQLRSGSRSQDGKKGRSQTPTSLCRCHEDPRLQSCAPSPSSGDCELRSRHTWHQKHRCNVSAANDLVIPSVSPGTLPGVWPVAKLTHPVAARPPKEQLKCFGCWENHTAKYRGCAKWKEARAALGKRSPAKALQSGSAAGHPAATNASRTAPSAEQQSLGSGWNHFVHGERVVKALLTPRPKPVPEPVKEPPRENTRPVL